jgi:phenylacetate-CoA ligase
MKTGGSANGLPSAASGPQDSLAELVELVRTANAFQRTRLEGLPAHSGLEAIPLLTKEDLISDQERHPPFGTNLTYPLEQYTHLHQTSGTTGAPLRVLDTPADWRWWRRGLARTFRAAGIGRGDRVALAFSFGPHVQFWAARDGLDEVGAMAVPLGGMTSAQRLGTMAAVEADALMCTPTYALRLAEVAVEEGLEWTLASVRLVVCTGESGASLPSVRSRIEEAFGARCLDHAGLTEVGPFGYPCAEGGGLHIDQAEFICETLDERQLPAPAEERAELVLTPLRRTGFPVLRYRTGDVVFNTRSRCPAGHRDRWLPSGIVGRTDDMVVIRGMNVYPSVIEEAVRRVGASGEFRITFYSEVQGMDEIRLEVELNDAVRARRLQELIRQQIGLRVRIVPVAMGMLPRRDGKSRRVVDERFER